MLEVSRIGASATHEAFFATRGIARLQEDAARSLGLDRVRAASVQFAGEHCTECAAPDCHATCDLFERGCTGRCRRFADGIVIRRGRNGFGPYSLEVLFKPWGQIICVGNLWCVGLPAYRLLANIALWLGRLSLALQGVFRFLPGRTQWCITDKIRGAGNRIPRWLNRWAARGWGVHADALICVVGNPQPEAVLIEVALSGFGDSQHGRVFRRTQRVSQGWHLIEIPAGEIAPVIDLGELFRIAIIPVVDRPVLLQFAYFGFVAWKTEGQTADNRPQTSDLRPKTLDLRPQTSDPKPKAMWEGHSVPRFPVGDVPAKKIKLLITDLDETLWDGIFVENPERDYTLRPGVLEVLEELDRRGILLSIASKNQYSDAQQLLERLGIWSLFLRPQINWEPKSASIDRITKSLNLGRDSVAFIDDSEFERREVKNAFPEVQVFDAAEFLHLPELPAFTVPITEESRKRRSLYQQESVRESAFTSSALDYDSFLKNCDMRLHLTGLDSGNRERVFELVQRTNQLNFSGTHYSRESLDTLLGQPGMAVVVMRCEDRYGDYGIVGAAMVRVSVSGMDITDLMFSCRIQGKKVEHSFFRHMVQQAKATGGDRCRCRFTPTARNTPAAKVLEEAGFGKEPERDAEGCQWYTLNVNAAAFQDVPVRVIDERGSESEVRGRRSEVGVPYGDHRPKSSVGGAANPE